MSARLDGLALAWSAWAAPLALQFTLLAAALLVVDRCCLRRVWPRLRLALHGVVLLGLVLPPLPAPFVHWPPLLPQFLPRASSIATSGPAGGAASLAAGGSLLTLAFVLWLAIATLLAAGVLWRHARVRARLQAGDLGAAAALRVRVAAIAHRLRLRRVPGVVVLSGATSPAVLGCWRPLVLLPAALAQRDDDELEHTLLHELLHVKRGDLLAALLARLVAIVWWFHPLAWIVARRATALRELACDDDVARLLRERAPAYRATLLERVRQLVAEPQLKDTPESIIALGFFAAPSTLLARLEWLARPRRVRPRLERAVTWLAAGVLALGALPAARAELGPTPPLARDDADASLRAMAYEIVQSALRGDRPPGCLRLQHSVALLAAAGLPASPER